MTRRLLSNSIYAMSGLIGLAAFLYPFFLPQLTGQPLGEAGATNSPLLTMVLLAFCLVILLLEVQGQAVSSKVIAALGVLVAVTAVLRFVEVAIPGPGGFSPIFAPIILAGYVFGGRFGFLMGTMTMLVSALITGGVGPWLPYQMLSAGWVGLSAGWLPRLPHRRWELLMLAGFGFAWGLFYGLLINLTIWPFMAGNAATSWQPGGGVALAVKNYLAFYLITSFVWDLVRAFGNALLILALGTPTIRALSRFRDRFQFEVQPV